MDMKNFWVSFVEGRISVPEMLAQTDEEPALLDWLTDIADSQFITYTLQRDDDGEKNATQVANPFDAKLQIQTYVHEGHGSRLGRYLNIHGYFSRVLTAAFPDDGIVVDKTLSEQFNFMLDACPEYIGGPEVDGLLDELLAEIPQDLNKTKRAKLYKEKVKAMFHITGNQFPRWIQSAEWPISPSGKPMRFVEQKKEKGKAYSMTLYTHFIFEDVDTSERRVIDQFT